MTSKNPTRRRVPSRPTRDRNRLRPTLTMLEDRRLLSTYIVNNPTDAPVTGETDLRQAIVQATSGTTNDTITFDSTVFNTPQTITLGGSQLNLTKATGTLAIQGPGANLLSISGNNASRVFYLNGGSASLLGLTITGGGSVAEGAGIYDSDGTVSLTNVNIEDNSAIGPAGTDGLFGQNGGPGGNAEGGGIYQTGGILTLNNVAISSNRAAGGAGGQAGSGGGAMTSSGGFTGPAAGPGGVGSGGGIYQANGTLTITGSTIAANTANDGGGIWGSHGDVTISGGNLSGNAGGGSGGGIYDNAGNLRVVSGCEIQYNSASNGGGIYQSSGTLTITNSTLSTNTGGGSGGGIDASGDIVTISGGAISNNASFLGGGILSGYGYLTVTDCTISNNSAAFGYGGGVYSFSQMTLTNDNISNNSAEVGGGIFTDGLSILTNDTISNNSATSDGGGISVGYVSVTVTLTNVTVSDNSTRVRGGGVENPVSTVNVVNSIIAGNTSSSSAPDIYGSFNSEGHNLIGITAGSSSGDFEATGDLTGNASSRLNPLLASLGNYGGPTQTMPPLPGSPAIDAGTTGTGVPTTDQRGLGRVGNVDIGAVESQGYTLTVTGGNSQTALGGAAFASPLTVSVAPDYPNDPVDGGVITFTPPATGASASLSTTSATISGGSASVTATANDLFGAYTVTATASGVAAGASFGLTNVGSLVVNNPTDSPVTGETDLRQAIAYAEFLSGDETVTFDPTVFNTPQTITLGGSQLDLTKASGTLAIQGPGANMLSVSGNQASRVFALFGGAASLSGLTITGGNAISGDGLSNSYYGGGLANSGGTVTLSDCTVSGNFAGIDGGGLMNYNGGTATLSDCTVSGNFASYEGGGLMNRDGTATLSNCTVSGNHAGYNGGGLMNYNGGTATLSDCTVSGNNAQLGGGLANVGGTATLSDCTVSGNSADLGGGLANYGGEAKLGLTDCTMSGNSANSYGGGLFNSGGTATLSDCTVGGNSASSGGGVYNRLSTAMLINCTISGNSASSGGGGVYNNYSNGTVNAVNTIIAGQAAGGDIQGPYSGSNNLIGGNPLLAPLGNYGGPTQTMALMPGSPAIDAGTTGTGVPTTDQRGLGRVGNVDIGAVESQGYTLTVTGGNSQTALGGAAFASPLAVSVAPDYSNDPVNGGVVTFTAPATGASASLSTTSATISGGSASVTATANGVEGAYTVTASASEGNSASFALTNVLQPTFAGLNSATTTYGTRTVTFTGTLAAGATPRRAT